MVIDYIKVVDYHISFLEGVIIFMKKFLPELVRKLGYSCSGWLCGGAVLEENPKDYDVYIPINHWKEASMLIPKDATVNRMGGFKCISEGAEVDVWTCDMSDLITAETFKIAKHLNTGIVIKKK